MKKAHLVTFLICGSKVREFQPFPKQISLFYLLSTRFIFDEIESSLLTLETVVGKIRTAPKQLLNGPFDEIVWSNAVCKVKN